MPIAQSRLQKIDEHLKGRDDIRIVNSPLGDCVGIDGILRDPQEARTLQRNRFIIAPATDILDLGEAQRLLEVLNRDFIDAGIFPRQQINFATFTRKGVEKVSPGKLVFIESLGIVQIQATFSTSDVNLMPALFPHPQADVIMKVDRPVAVEREISVTLYPTAETAKGSGQDFALSALSRVE